MDEEDLTQSHWDDMLSSNRDSVFNMNSSSLPPILNNEFSDLRVDDNDESEENQEHQQHWYNEDEDKRYDEIERERRDGYGQKIFSELTKGQDDDSWEASMASPKQVKGSELLFNDQDSPIKVARSQQETTGRSLNHKKIPLVRKYNASTVLKHLQGGESANPLETNDASSNGNEAANSNTSYGRARFVEEANRPLYHVPETEVSESDPPTKTQQGQDDASGDRNKPVFTSEIDISVGDPMKVGDITNSYIVYSIKTTKKKADTKLLPEETNTFTVSRRYRDFRWIYHQLLSNHPGRIIPPPPSKNYIGRFNENFVENRRLLLEKMVNKIADNPHLYDDPDFIIFLTSNNFVNDSKERENVTGSGASQQNEEYLDLGSASPSIDSNASVIINNASTGFMSSIFSMTQKVSEPDEYFVKQKQYFELLEQDLKNLSKAIELVSNQRSDMVGLLDQISLAIEELAGLEFLKGTKNLLNAFSEVQLKLKDNLDRVNIQEQLTMGLTVDEYLRIIGSIKLIFHARSKIYQQFYNFQQEYSKKLAQLDKLKSKVKAPNEKVNLLSFETDKLKGKAETFESNFNSISATIKEELGKFEVVKIDDFRNSVEIFIESSIESQKEAIELWETFYELQDLSGT